MLVAAALLGGVAYGVWCVLDELLGRSLLAQIVSRRRGLRSGAPSTPRSCCAARAGGAPDHRLIRGRLRRARLVTSPPPMADQAHIRNFSIIAHIDHGKSTLADRILEMTHTVDPREMRAQLLDSMDLERERGITIKAQAVRVFYEARGRRDLPAAPDRHARPRRLHLRGLPLAGRVRGRAAGRRRLPGRRGADARQHLPRGRRRARADPGLNKIDLPGAEPERVAEEVAELIGEDPHDVRRISAKTGEGVTDVLEELVERVPPPDGDPDAPPRALIFDSEFDQYRGVVAYIRVVDGTFRKGEAIRAMAAGTRGRHRRHRLLHARDDARRAS